MGDGVRSWCPGYGPHTGLAIHLDPAEEPEQPVLASLVTSLALEIALGDKEADPTSIDRRQARALLVTTHLLTLLDIPARPHADLAGMVADLRKELMERGWCGAAAEAPVEDLVTSLLKAIQEVWQSRFDAAVDTIIQLENKANQLYSTTKNFGQRAIFTKFILFAFLFRACYSEADSTFHPVDLLSRKQKDDIHVFLRSRIKSLFDVVKRKSTFFSSSIKNKHQEGMDDMLRCFYPLYSESRGWSSAHLLVRDTGPEERLDLHINPEFLPASEERPVVLQLGMVQVEEDLLAPLHVFLWRDEKHLFLRRQEKVFRFVVTHGGPNSILHIQLSRDRIKSKNTLHPTLVSSELPRKLMSVEKLMKDVVSAVPTVAVYREMAAVGEVHLQALGVQVNQQNSRGESLLHLAARRGRLEVVEGLLEAGAHRHLRDAAGLHPLLVAVLEAEAMESEEVAERVVRLLAAGDSRLDLPDAAGRTVLHHASALLAPSLRARLVTALVEAGAPLTCRDEGGDLAVDLAYRLSESTLFDTGA